MSTCISRDGEFGEHQFGEPAPRFTCRRCWVFDEDAALAALAACEAARAEAEARVAAGLALAEQPDTWPDYLATDYDRGRVEQRHADALDLYAALTGPAEREGSDR